MLEQQGSAQYLRECQQPVLAARVAFWETRSLSEEGESNISTPSVAGGLSYGCVHLRQLWRPLVHAHSQACVRLFLGAQQGD